MPPLLHIKVIRSKYFMGPKYDVMTDLANGRISMSLQPLLRNETAFNPDIFLNEINEGFLLLRDAGFTSVKVTLSDGDQEVMMRLASRIRVLAQAQGFDPIDVVAMIDGKEVPIADQNYDNKMAQKSEKNQQKKTQQQVNENLFAKVKESHQYIKQRLKDPSKQEFGNYKNKEGAPDPLSVKDIIQYLFKTQQELLDFRDHHLLNIDQKNETMKNIPKKVIAQTNKHIKNGMELISTLKKTINDLSDQDPQKAMLQQTLTTVEKEFQPKNNNEDHAYQAATPSFR